MRFSSCAWFLTRTRAREGSSSCPGRRTGGAITARVSIGAGLASGTGGGADGGTSADASPRGGLASWYSHALSAIPQLAITSKSAKARDQRFPPWVAMRQPYRHRRRIRPAGVDLTLNGHASKKQYWQAIPGRAVSSRSRTFLQAADGLRVPDAPSAPDRCCLLCQPVSQPRQCGFSERPRNIGRRRFPRTG